ncbi:LCP family protein [Streptomyces xantholiticus]|uniref:LCP family protein n=1 Tax=Streptomyces xantholiticus TaxID=68285 RepID=UPI003D9F5696
MTDKAGTGSAESAAADLDAAPGGRTARGHAAAVGSTSPAPADRPARPTDPADVRSFAADRSARRPGGPTGTGGPRAATTEPVGTDGPVALAGRAARKDGAAFADPETGPDDADEPVTSTGRDGHRGAPDDSAGAKSPLERGLPYRTLVPDERPAPGTDPAEPGTRPGERAGADIREGGSTPAAHSGRGGPGDAAKDGDITAADPHGGSLRRGRRGHGLSHAPDGARTGASGSDRAAGPDGGAEAGAAATGNGPRAGASKGSAGRRPGGGAGRGRDGAGPRGVGDRSGPVDGGRDGAGPGGPGARGPGDGSGPGDGAGRRRRHLMRWGALGVSLVLLAAAGAGWWFYRKLDSNITTDTTAAAELRAYEKERPTPVATGAQNILLIGSDTRAGEGNSKYGRDEGGGSQRSDTTILLHIAADRKSATAMSIPRDLMVTVPSCGKADGSRTGERLAQFNWAFQFGGAACTIRTVEKFTGIRIDHHMVIDFRGFKDMVDAVDGVEVCLKEPIDDKDARLELPTGPQTLHGEQALGFVRARKTLGNGSDTARMERQQQFLGALVKKVQSNGVLLNPTRLYPVLDAATKSITTDPGLDSLRDLYDLTRSIRGIPTEKVQFLTVPRQPHSSDPNRDELVQPEAEQLFKSLREDAPVTVVPNDERDAGRATGEPDAGVTTGPSPTPTFPGTNAAEGMCE